MNTPLEIYQQAIASGKIQANPAQEAIVKIFDKLFHQLIEQSTFFGKSKRQIMRYFGSDASHVKGLYLWGEVGRGKTFVMDLFFHALPLQAKKRLHFHRFMQNVHHLLEVYKGTRDPLKQVAKDFGKNTLVLCFDEFYVEDIADAMILGGLFKYLTREGITLVLTSNTPPENLYANGLQRDRFLPTISLIQQHTQIVTLSHPEDYRTTFLQQHKLYHYPLNPEAALQMALTFEQLADGAAFVPEQKLKILGREIATIKCGENIVWFSFETLCTTARSVHDYIEIARSFRIVLLSDVKIMTSETEAFARRFIALVDEFYERHVTLVISAEVSFDALYQGRRYQKEFLRTLSRLTEMQSVAYLAKPHLG